VLAVSTDPNADCEDEGAVPGAPTAVRVASLEGTHTDVASTAVIEFDQPLDDVRLASRAGGGAWLMARAAASQQTTIHAVAADDPAGTRVAQLTTSGPASIAPWRDGFAVLDRAVDGIALRLRLYTADGSLIDDGAIPTAATRPEARPALIASPDSGERWERRALLLRADCDL
jgi:hypothetical protein